MTKEVMHVTGYAQTTHGLQWAESMRLSQVCVFLHNGFGLHFRSAGNLAPVRLLGRTPITRDNLQYHELSILVSTNPQMDSLGPWLRHSLNQAPLE
jgi:hypothetical protein